MSNDNTAKQRAALRKVALEAKAYFDLGGTEEGIGIVLDGVMAAVFSQKRENAATPIADFKVKFGDIDSLPDNAVISDPVAARVLGVSVRTLRRSSTIPVVRLSDRRIGRRVGDIKALVRGEREL